MAEAADLLMEERYEPVILYRCKECGALGDVGYIKAHNNHHNALRKMRSVRENLN